MGKLGDLIQRATRLEPAPLGFGSRGRKAPPNLILVAIAGERWPDGAREAVEAGADAVVFEAAPSEHDLREAVAAAGDRPCGVVAGDASDLSSLREAGVDFIVIDPGAPAAALQDERLDCILRVREDLDDTRLRTIDALDLAALFLDQGPPALSVQRMMDLQRVAGLAQKPLLLRAHPDSQQSDLIALRDAGVTLLGLELRDRGVDALRRLRPMVDDLPRKQRRRSEARPGALVPRAAQTAAEEDDEDE